MPPLLLASAPPAPELELELDPELEPGLELELEPDPELDSELPVGGLPSLAPLFELSLPHAAASHIAVLASKNSDDQDQSLPASVRVFIKAIVVTSGSGAQDRRMRKDIVPGAAFPDYDLPDQTGKRMRASPRFKRATRWSSS